MKDFSSPYIRLEEQSPGIKKIILTRPDLKNAFNAEMISDLNTLFLLLSRIQDPNELRLVILSGEGDVFCAGADLNYMKEQAEKNYQENLQDASHLGGMFFHLATLPCPVISVVKGAVIAGGLGLCACSDYVLAEEKSIFSTSEVRIGLIPALISPYIIRKVGTTHASYLMLTGEKISANEALKMNLINQVVPASELETTLNKTIKSFLMAEPKAARTTKALIQKCVPLPQAMLFKYTANQIARVRSSKEGKEGLNYFFTKQRPHWHP